MTTTILALAVALWEGPWAAAPLDVPPPPAVVEGASDRDEPAVREGRPARTAGTPTEPARRPTVAPGSRAGDARLRRGEGRGLVIAGAAVTGTLHLALHVWEAVMVPFAAPVVWSCVIGGRYEDEEWCGETGGYAALDALVGAPLNASMSIGVGLIAAGLKRHGASIRRRGLPPGRLSRAQLDVRRKVGWGLLGTGMAVWGLGVVNAALVFADIPHCAKSRNPEGCLYGLHVRSMAVGGGLVAAGLSLGPFASGYLREDARLGSLQVAPLTLPGGGGLLVGGRF